MSKGPLPAYVNPNPVTITCLRCSFVFEAPIVEAHAAFAAHSCAHVATVGNGRAKS